MRDDALGFTIAKTLHGSCERAWTAWTDADALSAWLRPGSSTVTPRDEVQVDARVGGAYRYTMVDEASGNRVVTAGVYTSMTPYVGLELTWGYPDAAPEDAPLISLSFDPTLQGTNLTFELVGVEGRPGDGMYYDGWAGALDSLAKYLAGEPAA